MSTRGDAWAWVRRLSLLRPAQACAVCAACALACTLPPARSAAPATESVRTARFLDQQGVLAYEAGRYHDALIYFEAALAHGGPASERWNAAKCHLRLDEPEKADADLAAYLAMSDLAAEDRRDGRAELEAVRQHPSTLTVISTPLALPVWVDGARVGMTPLSVPLAPGDHVVLVLRGPDARDVHPVSARMGKAILVESNP